MNIVVVIAGGVGSRMGANVPKQFIKVKGKHVLAYTLESFQNNNLIDAIEVVCIDGWKNDVWEYKTKYGFFKLKWITKGGSSAQESIRNGVYNLKDKVSDKDNIIIHDGIRPLVEDYVLEDLIKKCNQYGNAVTSIPYNEQIFLIDNEISTIKYIPRETLRRVATPQAYKFDLLYEKYQEAFTKKIGIYGSSYTNTMMVDLGVRLYFAAGSDRNIKLTTKGDLEIFEAMLEKGAN